jgi:LacI family transcriptional regulator
MQEMDTVGGSTEAGKRDEPCVTRKLPPLVRSTSMEKTRVKRVAVLVETSNVYGREIQLGIADYVRDHARWSMFVEQHELGALPPPWLLRQKWDGIISRPTNAALAGVFARMRVPVVDLNDLHHDLGYPRLQSDNHAIGRMAAEHLRERGFANYAYCGFTAEAWACERKEGYLKHLHSAGLTAGSYETPWRGRKVLPWALEQKKLTRWLKSLPQPVGIFACNDVRGRQLLEACRGAQLTVPAQMAVLGVDNDELLCRMSDPPLSSVVPDAHRIGFEAAEILDGLMVQRKNCKPVIKLIPPRKVVTRQSTDVLAIEDEDIAGVLRFIRDKACTGIRMDDVLSAFPLSRSLLERRFKQCLGHSPHTEIRAVQIRKAAQLLDETDLPLKHIATQCGISHMEYLSYLFKKNFGQSPGSFRRLRARKGDHKLE